MLSTEPGGFAEAPGALVVSGELGQEVSRHRLAHDPGVQGQRPSRGTADVKTTAARGISAVQPPCTWNIP